jgi:hydrogenase-4 component F
MSLPLLLLIPLAASLLCLVSGGRRLWEAANVGAAIVVAGLAVRLGFGVLQHGTVTAWDGLLYADALSALVILLVGFVFLASAIYAVGYFREDERQGRVTLRQLRYYHVLTPLFVAVMLLVPMADNLGIMWVAVEGTTLASVLLVTFYNQKTSFEAGWKYIMLGSVGITLALFGTILTYYSAVGVLGEESPHGLNWSVLMPLADKFNPAAMRLAFVMILVGYGTKAGLAPMHTWKPDAYAEAPVPSSALLGAGFINCAIYAIIRFHVLASKCLGEVFPSSLLICFGVGTILVAAPFIIVQRNFRRLLAYSSIDHGGIIVAALGFGGPLGSLAAVLHMLFHAVTKPLLFFCAGNIQQHFGSPFFRRVSGAVKVLPWSGGFFILATVAVTGTPPFSIFQSEFMAVSAAMTRDYPLAAGLMLFGLVVIFAGFLGQTVRLTLGAGPQPGAPPPDECRWKLGAVLLVALAVLTLSFWMPAPLYQLAERAAGLIEVKP